MAPRLKDQRVCFVGDSFVAGVGDPQHLGWVGRLAARTHREGHALSAYNLGVRGQTSRDVRHRWLAQCAPRLPPGCAGRVVFSFGVNDTTVEDGLQRVPPSDSRRNLAAVLAGAAAARWPALVVGPPPVADPAHNARIAALEAVLRGVCYNLNVGYIATLPVLLHTATWMREVSADDGAHPNATGYALMTDLIWPHWIHWLRVTANRET